MLISAIQGGELIKMSQRCENAGSGACMRPLGARFQQDRDNTKTSSNKLSIKKLANIYAISKLQD